jgi:hypothetical protein
VERATVPEEVDIPMKGAERILVREGNSISSIQCAYVWENSFRKEPQTMSNSRSQITIAKITSILVRNIEILEPGLPAACLPVGRAGRLEFRNLKHK